MHTRPPQSHGQRRSSSRPLDVAASLVLTVGLLGAAAPVAQASEETPTAAGSTSIPVALPQVAPSPSSTPAVEHPALERSIVADFEVPTGAEPDRSVRVNYAIRLTNTGDVPLIVSLRGDFAPVTIAVGESRDVAGRDSFSEYEFSTGFVPLDIEGQATTPLGASIDAGVSASVPYPAGLPGLEHPSLERSVTAVFAPEGSGTRADYTVHLKNTGDVPLQVVLKAITGPGQPPLTLAAGESRDITGSALVSEKDLRRGYWAFNTSGDAYTPRGIRIEGDLGASIAIRATPPAQPTPVPSPPSTPTPAPSQPATPSTPTPSPTAVPTVAGRALTVTITGKFLTQPGELVKEGTRVEFSYDVKNTGTVDLTDVLGRKKLAVGESFLLTTTEAVVTAQNIKDGFVAPDAESMSETVPGGTRVVVSAPKLPIPDKAPVSTEKPDLDVKVSGTFQVKAGEPVVAGTKVKWVASLTNTGDTALRDVQVADSEKIAELPVGKSGEVSFESTVSERDVLDHSISVAAAATAITRDGYDYSKQTLGTLAIPAVAPAPAGPDTPASAGPVSPAPAGPDAQPSSAAAARSVTEVATSSSRGEVATSASSGATRSTAGHLASTGSDAAAMLPAAGVLALLGAVGVFLGRRRRSRTATE
ncbi:LPXTG cell wall anchor domain-containing protein [Rathayibacter sp. VKM Ac-2857]|uniref:LPXTG cell wall anchor domain-containing protein n=1 Tax=Rathayibacter sp. VKM Ac-2857 TaxID=2739020 RepID=UPI001566F183|nr:LPXTG cell wall anchor domain-containing protein [Rathayibacter sp. VKM Ac-2857]NQX18095.1 LPXTG cell wall anchor domain-containing protein [Rathayibacter sp. VKM Ac-2857]